MPARIAGGGEHGRRAGSIEEKARAQPAGTMRGAAQFDPIARGADRRRLDARGAEPNPEANRSMIFSSFFPMILRTGIDVS